MTKFLLPALLAIACAPAALQADDLLYDPIVGDHVLDISKVAGTYINQGLSLTFYSADLLDDDFFVEGYGDLLNVELYAEAPDDPNFTFGREYAYYDIEAYMNDPGAVEKYGPGDFLGGFIYNYSGYLMPMGTYAQIYDENLLDVYTGLIDDGSLITVSSDADGIYTFDFDLYTKQGAHLTAHWSGPLAEYVQFFPEISGVSSISDCSPVTYYNLQGVVDNNPQPGKVYISVQNGQARKVLFR